jgi:hypothetical protein
LTCIQIKPNKLKDIKIIMMGKILFMPYKNSRLRLTISVQNRF